MATHDRPAMPIDGIVAIATSPRTIITSPTPTMIVRTTTPIGSSPKLAVLLVRLRRGRVGLDDHRGPVGHDLGHVARHLAAVEAHRDDRVGAHDRGVLDEPVQGLAAGVLEELGVLVDLAPAEGAQAGHEVAREAAAPDDEAEGLALRLGDAVAGDERGGRDDHERASGAWAARSPQGQRSRSSTNG